MACGKTTHENLKDASESVRHALIHALENKEESCLLYTSPSPRD